MCKACCIYCCTEPPARDFSTDKKLCSCCCKSSIICAKNACMGCDLGCSTLEWMVKHPLNPEHVGQYEYRPIQSQRIAGNVSIIKDIPKPAWTSGCGTGCFSCCGCCRLDCAQCCSGKRIEYEKALQSASYTWVMENRLEYNVPYLYVKPPKNCSQWCMQCLCPCTISPIFSWCAPPCSDLGVGDNARVLYFDNDAFNEINKSPPCCYSWKMWCYGGYGVPLRLKRRRWPCIKPCCAFCYVRELEIRVRPDEFDATREAIVTAVAKAREGCKAPKLDEFSAIVAGAQMSTAAGVKVQDMTR